MQGRTRKLPEKNIQGTGLVTKVVPRSQPEPQPSRESYCPYCLQRSVSPYVSDSRHDVAVLEIVVSDFVYHIVFDYDANVFTASTA